MENVWTTGRIEAFSDGVFAIAITLLVLDIHVPESYLDDFSAGIGNQWPSYVAYATSFFTVGGLWMAHHGIFRRLQYANRAVMVTNLLLLMAVSFLPFPTRLLAEAIHTTDAERIAVILYGAWLVVIAALFGLMVRTITRNPSLLRPEADQKEIVAILKRTTPSIGFYVAVIVLAFKAPRAAVFLFLGIAISGLVSARGEGRATAGTPDEANHPG